MRKNNQIIAKLDEINDKLDRIDIDKGDLDEQINRVAEKLERLVQAKCERDGVSFVAVSSGPLDFVAG